VPKSIYPRKIFINLSPCYFTQKCLLRAHKIPRTILGAGEPIRAKTRKQKEKSKMLTL
jgi:hypothetical protein